MNVITPFRWYDKYHKQTRFDKSTNYNCPFELICDQAHLLPFQFSRPQSGYRIDTFVIRKSCEVPFEPLLENNESLFTPEQNTWFRLSFEESCGGISWLYDSVSILRLNGYFYKDILTIGKRYNICFSITKYASADLEIIVSNGSELGIYSGAGYYETGFFEAIDARVLFESLNGSADDTMIITDIQIFEDFEIIASDVEIDPFLPKTMNTGDTDYISYCGSTLYDPAHAVTMLKPGTYYAIIGYYPGIYYFSEVFTVKEFLPQKSPYYILEWKNSCDIGNVIYQPISLDVAGHEYGECDYKNRLYLEGPITRLEYPFVEEGQTDGAQTFHATFKRWQKDRLFLIAKAPEFIVDALTAIRLHDTITLTEPLQEQQQQTDAPVVINEIEYVVKPVFDDCFSSIELKLTMDETITDASCCNNITVIPCITCNGTIMDINDTTSDFALAHGYALILGEIGSDALPDGLYLYDYNSHEWLIVEEIAMPFTLCISGSDQKYFYLGPDVINPWVLLPEITDFGYDGSCNFNVELATIIGTFFQVEYMFNASPWTALPTIHDYSDTAFEINLPGCPGCGTISIRIHVFTMNCDYGYSNTATFNNVLGC